MARSTYHDHSGGSKRQTGNQVRSAAGCGIGERCICGEELEILFALPINKELGGYAAITPGAIIAATQQDVGGNKDPISQYITIHGSKTNDSRVLLDGVRFNAEGQGRGFYFNPAAAQSTRPI